MLAEDPPNLHTAFNIRLRRAAHRAIYQACHILLVLRITPVAGFTRRHDRQVRRIRFIEEHP